MKNNIIDNKYFIELIRAIIKRPGMYSVNRVEDISLVIFGYLYALRDDTKAHEINSFLVNFGEFVNNHFETTTKFHWSRLIHLYSGSDPNSIEVFADLFEQFIKAN